MNTLDDLDIDFIDLDGPLVEPETKPKKVTKREDADGITETAKAAPVQGVAYTAKADSSWGWTDLRDFIMGSIEERHGIQVRDAKKEAGIIKSFMARWPDGQAVRIARTAFEVHGGMWRGAPISITRFCRASDKWFAQPIADNF